MFKTSIHFFFISLISLFLVTVSIADELENRVTSFVNNLTDSAAKRITSIIGENERVKYLDINLGVKEHLKPTISITNVNKISEKDLSVFFNQNSLSLHDDDQTINIGIGHRSLHKNETIIIGLNAFFDYSFDEAHQRNGAGLEVISSIFDLRTNIYDATSGKQITGTGKDEEALDGWDLRLDYHIPIKRNLRIFASMFDFENGAGSFELEGEKYGLHLISNNFDFEVGYVDDNKAGDGTFANIKYVVPIGNTQSTKYNNTNEMFEYVNIKDRIYEPVKRENKIRVVKTTLNVKASGF